MRSFKCKCVRLVALAFASIQLAACTSPAAPPHDGNSFGALAAHEGVNQQFTLTVKADFDKDSPFGGCKDEVSLVVTEKTVQDGLANPVKTGLVEVSVWTCLPSVFERFHFIGTTDLLGGDLYSNLPDSAHLIKTVTLVDQHLHPELDLRSPFDMTFNLEFTGEGDVIYGASSLTETPAVTIDTRGASRGATVAGSTNAGLSWLKMSIPPVHSTASATGEWIDTVAKDDPPTCGDTVCNGTETNATCPSDCPPVCGDAVCNGSETNASCPIDCPPICGDLVCNGTENNASCASDCPPICGDAVCNGSENIATCPSDCPPICGDLICSASETNASCPGDCRLTNGLMATNVLGQPDFSSKTCATTQSGMGLPRSSAYDAIGQRLFVADDANSRVLVYDVADIANGEPAVHVLGQPGFASNGHALTQTGLYYPFGVAYDAPNQRLFVADSYNNRVLVYDVATIADGEPAVHVLGQPGFSTNWRATTQTGMFTPYGLMYDAMSQHLFVADSDNHRVLVYDVAAITDGEPAINVLGQPIFTSSARATTQTGMSNPIALAYDATNRRLFVADNGSNSRILVYDIAAITDGEPAINVLGQPNFTSYNLNGTSSGMRYPYGVTYDEVNQRLYVADTNNGRVNVYDAASITDGEPAVYFLGQNGFSNVYGVTYDATHRHLFVSDGGNCRVLVYDP